MGYRSSDRSVLRRVPPLACQDMGHDTSLRSETAAGEAAAGGGAADGDADAGEAATYRVAGPQGTPAAQAAPGPGTPRDGGRLLVASNRGPLSFTLAPDGSLSARRGGGGLVSGLMPGLASLSDRVEVMWICAALSDADREAARQDPDGSRFGIETGGAARGRTSVRALDIPAGTFQGAYNAVANATLWFVHHLLFDTPVQPRFGPAFRRDWQSYVAYNEAFASALARGAVPEPAAARVLVQDYHLALVPRMLRELVPGIRIAHFSHTPWAPVDYYRILPDDVGPAVLDGMLGADHAGFLCQRWADAFLDCCEALLGAQVDRAAQRVIHRGHVTGVGIHPLGVDAPALRERARGADVDAHVSALTEAAAGRKLIVRIDRAELSKNILRGLGAYREMLTTRPEWRGRVIHVALAYPSRGNVPGYREYTEEVLETAARITEEFATADWNPLVLEVKDDYARSLAAARVADVLVVNPIRDGMNLVAEEGPVLSDRGCALVLSREAGAAALLGSDALLVNPYDVSATANAMHQALLMPEDERRRRCTALAAAAASKAPAQWLTTQLDALG
jgi:trehalose 6-phosphate synthase